MLVTTAMGASAVLSVSPWAKQTVAAKTLNSSANTHTSRKPRCVPSCDKKL
jgi:hypothetical protein